MENLIVYNFYTDLMQFQVQTMKPQVIPHVMCEETKKISKEQLSDQGDKT